MSGSDKEIERIAPTLSTNCCSDFISSSIWRTRLISPSCPHLVFKSNLSCCWIPCNYAPMQRFIFHTLHTLCNFYRTKCYHFCITVGNWFMVDGGWTFVGLLLSIFIPFPLDVLRSPFVIIPGLEIFDTLLFKSFFESVSLIAFDSSCSFDFSSSLLCPLSFDVSLFLYYLHYWCYLQSLNWVTGWLIWTWSQNQSKSMNSDYPFVGQWMLNLCLINNLIIVLPTCIFI